MTAPVITLLVTIFVITDLVVIGAVFHLAGQSWRELSLPFPAQPVEPDGVRKNFQSFKLGMINLGMCVHVAVDARHLHLYPALFMRVTMRAAPCSIPWSAIALKPGQKPTRRMLAAKVGKQELLGPRWCMELARPG